MRLSELLAVWRDRQRNSDSSQEYERLGEKILAHGEALLAYDVVVEALIKWPDVARLKQLQALALARSGAIERANAILEDLRKSGDTTEETLGILARTYKDLASRTSSAGKREHYLRHAAETYLEGYKSSGGYWTGINAATMSLLLGEHERAAHLAQEIQSFCQKRLLSQESDHYWVLAALGEAALILRQWPEAKQWYDRAKDQCGHRFADLASSRRNARLILRYWEREDVDTYIAMPPIVVFAGHMIDAPDRLVARFPASSEGDIATALSQRLQQLRPALGFASAACGSDILFLEAMLEVGCEVAIVLPYNKEQFIRDSVDVLPHGNWRERFDRVVENAAQCTVASAHKLELGSVSYDFGNELLLGLATIQAKRLDTGLIPLAVWDGKAGDAFGGTASAVEMWRSRGYTPEVIPLSHSSIGRAGEEEGTKRSDASEVGDAFTSRIVAILFADAVGFSKLGERAVPQFVKHFLGAFARLAIPYDGNIIARNTWGDGLYFILDNVEAAGKFALELTDYAAATAWPEIGLPANLDLRVALHAGPVYEFEDPITAKRSYTGTHVNRAARMEPITPPGHVYASESFAALAAARGADSFLCDYVGQTPLAKGYGTSPMYHVHWRVSTSPMRASQ